MLQWQTGPFLSHIVDRLRRGLDVQDRVYCLRTYKSCFVANEAVDFMVSTGLAESREEAVQLGRLMETKYHLWHHVCNDHDFKDEYLFFRFSDEEVKEKADNNKGASIQTIRAGMAKCVKNVTNRPFSPCPSPPKKSKNRIYPSGTYSTKNSNRRPPLMRRESETEISVDVLSEDGTLNELQLRKML